MSPQTLQPGRAFPLGAQIDGDGIDFAVFSAHAQAIELCLFDASGAHELQRLVMPARRPLA
jgi:glycogen operon protein